MGAYILSRCEAMSAAYTYYVEGVCHEGVEVYLSTDRKWTEEFGDCAEFATLADALRALLSMQHDEPGTGGPDYATWATPITIR